jgi:signal transduction histidine kinase
MIRSIRGNLLALAAVWLGAALLAAYLFISTLLEDFMTGRFDAEAMSVADGISATLEVDETGLITMPITPADPRFDLPFSGWYWQVEADGVAIDRSASLLDVTLDGPQGSYQGQAGKGANGAALRVLRREITLPDSDADIAITVTAPKDVITESLSQIRRPLGLALAVLGVGLVVASVVQVTLGLRSLDKLQADLRRVRSGHAPHLPEPRVTELQPLSHEINAAIDHNMAMLTRSRQHLGNLAHSLKTPLAALANELPQTHPGQSLITRMDRLIGWHLRRARSAQPQSLGQHTPLRPVIEDILLVLRHPMADKGITASLDCPDDCGFAGERQDLEEMIGNLSENAVKWGRRRIAFHASTEGGRLRLRIEDDGPGMTATDASRALIRGARLDENGPPGSGLGLAIVADLAALHGGELRLERAELGGLAAILDLPA